MANKIQVGLADTSKFPKESLGIFFYNSLKGRNPDEVAVIDTSSGQELTFGKILKLSTTLAKELKVLGIQKDDIVAIISPNNWQYLITILAGWYIGAKVNLLNNDYTSNELRHLFSICQPNIIFCSKKIKPNLFQLRSEFLLSTTFIVYDDEPTEECKNFDSLLQNDSNEVFNPYKGNPYEDVAFIVTSSGTTGLPKYVQLTHINFRATLVQNDYIGEDDTTICYLPFFHLFGFAVLLSSLISGRNSVIMEKFIPDLFLKTIQDYKVPRLFTVPPILLYFVKSPLVAKYDISSVTDVLCGAAPLGKNLEDMVEKRLNISCIRKVYGLTESGVATMSRYNEEMFGSVGKAAIGYQIKVCHIETGQLLSAGEVGELRIKGEGIMKGYLGSDIKEEDVFDEDGFLKSGDLGYYDEEGFFYIVDRLKELIKYKGFQVAPAELENLLSRHPAVQDVGVIGIPNERAGEVPLAFVVRQPNQNVTEEELVHYVEENISVQKHLYGGVKFVDAIPRVPSGKILKRELKKMYLSLK